MWGEPDAARASLESIPLTPTPAVLDTAEAASSLPGCLQCGFIHNAASDDRCMRCGASLDLSFPEVQVPPLATLPQPAATKRDARWTAQFPFGAVAIEPMLRIGRDERYSPLAAELSGFEKVSRRHAELAIENGILTVIDMNSTNGTLVNGVLWQTESRRSCVLMTKSPFRHRLGSPSGKRSAWQEVSCRTNTSS